MLSILLKPSAVMAMPPQVLYSPVTSPVTRLSAPVADAVQFGLTTASPQQLFDVFQKENKAKGNLNALTGEPRIFGTAGLRGQQVTAAHLDSLLPVLAQHYDSILLAGDTRPFARENLKSVAQKLATLGVTVYCVEEPLATPIAGYVMQAFEELFPGQKRPQAGLNLTASHNAYREAGLKLQNSKGNQFDFSETDVIEQSLLHPTLVASKAAGSITAVNALDPYFKALAKVVDWAAIRKSGLSIAVDTNYGAGTSFVSFLQQQGLAIAPTERCTTTVPTDNAAVMTRTTEPLRENLEPLIQRVKQHGAHIGIGLDGDADRFAAVDEQGRLLNVNDCLTLALLALKLDKKSGVLARNQGTTQFLDAAFAHLYQSKAPVLETPVGFKFLGKAITELTAKGQPVLLAAECAGGASSSYNASFDKDGLFIDALMLRAAADAKQHGKTVSQQVRELREQVPQKYAFTDINFVLQQAQIPAWLDGFRKLRESGGTFAGYDIDKQATQAHQQQFEQLYQTTDGVKLFLNDPKTGKPAGWVLIRTSGTEPKVRFYAEGLDLATQDQTLANTRLKALIKEALVQVDALKGSHLKVQLSDIPHIDQADQLKAWVKA